MRMQAQLKTQNTFAKSPSWARLKNPFK